MYPALQTSHDREVFLNIFRSYSVNSDLYNNESLFDYYTVQDDDWMDNISTIHYNTPYLWWIVGVFNGITNPYEELKEGSVLRVLKYSSLYVIFDDITEIESL